MRLQLFLAALVASASAEAATAAAAKPVKKAEESSSSNRVGCVANLNGYHFNLKELSLPIDETDRPNSQMYELDYQDATGTSTIQFNLCDETARQCPDLMSDHANMVNAAGTCSHLSKVQKENEPKPGDLSLISEANPQLGVIMSFEGGNMCDATTQFSLEVQINCNANLEKTTFALDKDSLKTPCSPRVIMNSPHGCPVLQMGPLANVLEHYNYWIGIPLLVLGGYFLFVGGQFPEATLFAFTTLAVSLAQLFAVFIFVLPGFIPTWTVLVVYFITFGMGAGLGFGASKWPKIGNFVMGASVGALIGFFLYYMFMAGTVSGSSAKQLTIGGAALITGIIYVTLFDQMIIVTSCIFGSYALVRGVSMYTGGYVNEFEVVMASGNGDIGQVRWTTFMFWGIMVCMTLIGISVQMGNRKTTKEAYNGLDYKFRQDGVPAERAARMSADSSMHSYRNSNADDLERRPILTNNNL